MSRKGPYGRFLIYGLTEADSSTIRYVGMSSSGLKRPRQHVAPSISSAATCPKGIWVRSLLANGKKPKTVVLEECSSVESLDAAEARWIEHLRAIGAPLLNVVAGGRAKGPGPTLDATRAKLRAAMLGRPKSPEHCRNMSLARKGFTLTPEARAKQAASMRGRQFTPEHRAKIAAGVKRFHALRKETGDAS